MAESREISTAALVSLTTGRLFCKFSEMHEAAEYVMGHPIWTHHFASKELNDEIRQTILAQHPGLPPGEMEDVNASNYLDHLAEIEAKHGKSLRVCKGAGLTAMLPQDGIPDHLKGKTILVEK